MAHVRHCVAVSRIAAQCVRYSTSLVLLAQARGNSRHFAVTTLTQRKRGERLEPLYAYVPPLFRVRKINIHRTALERQCTLSDLRLQTPGKFIAPECHRAAFFFHAVS
jgi:hypothetical protein